MCALNSQDFMSFKTEYALCFKSTLAKAIVEQHLLSKPSTVTLLTFI